MAANVRDRFDSGGIVAIRERPESALSGSSSSTSSASGFAPEQTPRTSPNTDWIGCGDRPYQNAKELA